MAKSLEICFMYLGYKQIYCVFKSCCTISVLFWELRCYGNFLLTFWDSLSVPPSKVKNLYSLDFWPMKMGPVGFPKMSVRNCNYSLCNSSEEPSSYLLCSRNLKSILCFTKFHLFYDFFLFCSNTFFINCALCKCFWIMWCTGACSMWRIKYL
jgi:hypothetical protein